MSCFSALQRAENSSIEQRATGKRGEIRGFSALQRAENSSIRYADRMYNAFLRFQCSSASRKFLNSAPRPHLPSRTSVSVLFSEPKIPQCARRLPPEADVVRVSVLFSEPKIPQFATARRRPRRCSRFSALQRAENSSIPHSSAARSLPHYVSVLFSEPKIPQFA